MRTALIKTGKAFSFTPDNEQKVQTIVARYPQGRQASAVIPVLHLAQVQHDQWISQEVVQAVADRLGMSALRVFEVVSFYTMFNMKPVGKHCVEICRTTPCWLRGSDAILNTCKQVMSCEVGETSPDGQFTLLEVECMGACVNAPMAAIDGQYYEDLDPERMEALLEQVRQGSFPQAGSQIGRQGSAPEGGPMVLKKGA